VFGVDEYARLTVVKSANMRRHASVAGNSMSKRSGRQQVLMMFFFKDWSELTEVPDLDRLGPDL